MSTPEIRDGILAQITVLASHGRDHPRLRKWGILGQSLLPFDGGILAKLSVPPVSSRLILWD